MSTLYTVAIHNQSFSNDDLILNEDIFSSIIQIGDLVLICFWVDNKKCNLVLKLSSFQQKGGRLEVSINKLIADSLNIKSYSRVTVDKINNIAQYTIDFVELTFKKQFLQRGNMWKFKQTMYKRPVYLKQQVSVGGVLSQIQELSNQGIHY